MCLSLHHCNWPGLYRVPLLELGIEFSPPNRVGLNGGGGGEVVILQEKKGFSSQKGEMGDRFSIKTNVYFSSRFQMHLPLLN